MEPNFLIKKIIYVLNILLQNVSLLPAKQGNVFACVSLSTWGGVFLVPGPFKRDGYDRGNWLCPVGGVFQGG